MGNSKLAYGCQTPTSPREALRDESNGILGRVPGDRIAAALQTLPPPSALGPETAAGIADGGHDLGLVQFTIERKRVKHGRHSHYYWAATRAEAVAECTPAVRQPPTAPGGCD